MEMRPIDEYELNLFVKNNPNVHYMKTGMWAHYKQQMDGLRPSFAGFYKEDMLVGTAVLLAGKWLMHSYLYVPWGICMDYSVYEDVRDAYTLLKQYADEKNVSFLRADPNVVRNHHTITGEVIEDGFNNEWVTDLLKDLGYTHKGYGYAYNGSWTNRYTLVVDLSGTWEQILAGFSKPRKTSLNRHAVIGVRAETGSADDIPGLMVMEKQLSEQEGFQPHTREFFERILQNFGDNAVIYVVRINLEEMISGIEQELAGKKYRKDPEARAAKEKEKEKAAELMKEYGRDVKIACGLFIRLGTWSWDLYTYNHKAFGFIKPVDQLHAFAMRDMKAHGVIHYDMCGFSGTSSKDDPYYGLYAYKRSFGPEFIEQIGEFDYVRHENEMKRYRFEKLAVNHLKRKYWALRYQKKEKNA